MQSSIIINGELLDLWTLIVMDIILFIGLAFLGIGYYLKTNNCHRFRMLGFAIFGIYWITQVPVFLFIGDLFNAILCIIALPFFFYLGYHEYLSYQWKEDEKSLKWMAGTSFIAGSIYFLIEKIPIISGAVVYVVAVQSVWLINAFGYNYTLGDLNYGNGLYYKTTFHEVSINVMGGQSATGGQIQLVLACTGVQSMMIFIGAIFCVAAVRRQKILGFLATVPVIYGLNLIRNASVIYMMYTLGWSYELAHHQIGKIGSLIALIALAFLIFKILPETLENIWGLMDLWSREERREAEPSKESPNSLDDLGKPKSIKRDTKVVEKRVLSARNHRDDG
jgi:archaeosortase A (PGF-CTERM-specific)